MKSIISILTIIIILSGCENHAKQKAEALQIKLATIDSLNKLIEQQNVIDSMKAETDSRNMRSSEEVNNIPIAEYDAVESKTKKDKK